MGDTVREPARQAENGGRGDTLLRAVLVGFGLLFTVLGFGYSLRMPWAVDMHLWADGPMTIVWFGSMLLSFGPQLVWLGAVREWGILPGFAAGSIVMFGGAAASVLSVYQRTGETRLLAIAIALAVLGLGSIGMLLWSRKQPGRDVRRTPALLRSVSAILVVPLLVASLGLLTRHPRVFPWPLNPDSSPIMGWMFLGTGLSFVFAVVVPRWQYMRTLLMGFIVYDAVLIPYYIGHYERVKPGHEFSLNVFMVVLTSTALLAIYYLFVQPSTRSWRIVTEDPRA